MKKKARIAITLNTVFHIRKKISTKLKFEPSIIINSKVLFIN